MVSITRSASRPRNREFCWADQPQKQSSLTYIFGIADASKSIESWFVEGGRRVLRKVLPDVTGCRVLDVEGERPGESALDHHPVLRQNTLQFDVTSCATPINQ